ncbi:MAG: 30S ribosomal protein S11 [Parcubacteria group bacterium]|nr:30S ribosomal protein S11 [Parcubacteria group bacterium]
MSDEQTSLDPVAEAAAAILAAPKQTGAKNKNAKRKKKRADRNVPTAIIYVQVSYNNTLMTATDLQGDTLAWSSAGGCGFRGPKKATPYAANVTTRVLVEKCKKFNVKEAHVFVKGVGSGRESAIRSIHSGGINVLSIKDVTPIPHNGCRRRKPRRI